MAVLRGVDFFVLPVGFFAPPEDLPEALVAVFLAPLLAALLLPPADLEAVLRGTLAPFSLASDNPIAIACLRDVTFLSLRPLLSLPFFISCMALSTLSLATFEYFAIVVFLVSKKLCLRKKQKNYALRDVGTMS